VRVGAGLSGLAGGNPGADIYAASGGGRVAEVRIFNNAGTLLNVAPIQPYGAGFKRAITIAVGDVNLDGIDDILIGPSAQSVADPVRLVDGATLTVNPALDIVPFVPLSGPIRVALTDVTGDGRLDAAITRGNLGREVTLWDLMAPGGPPAMIDQVFAYDLAYNGGLSLAGGSRTA
jgi:hypothetical protein